MAHGKAEAMIPAPSEAVFDLVHDYARRLEWDTLLSAAYLLDGATEAGRGVTSICVGRWYLGYIALQTVYVSFERPRVTAVKMCNTPPFFDTWAASMHHRDNGDGTSQMNYQFHFTVKPRWLRFVLDPFLERLFLWETQKRLNALQRYFLIHHLST